MTGTKPALQGYSASIKEWEERKYRHVSLTLSPFFQNPSILPSTNYARPFTPGFISMILMQCVLAPLKNEGSHLLSELLWKCTFISMQCSRVLIDEGKGGDAWNRHDGVDSRPPGSLKTWFGFSFQLFYCWKDLYHKIIFSDLKIHKKKKNLVQSAFLLTLHKQSTIFTLRSPMLSVIKTLKRPVHIPRTKAGICDAGTLSLNMITQFI